MKTIGQALKQSNKYSKVEVEKCAELLKYIYVNDEECFVRMLNKNTHKNKVYPINSLKDPMKLRQVMNSFGKDDVLLSLNPFRTMDKATRDNLFCINAIAVDVDYRRIKEFKDLQPEQLINLLEMDFFDTKIPAPSFIEYGNQVRLIYCIETCYIPKHRDNVVVLATRIAEVFAKELKEYGAEKQNIESYFRLPNSTNTRNSAKVQMMQYEDSIRYTLRELQELWLDELPSWYKRSKGRIKTPNKVVKLHNVFALNSNRLLDLEKIQSYLNDIGEIDLRARLCFLYRNYVLIRNKYQNGELTDKDKELAKEEMLKFNNKFTYPLRDRVIESATRVVNYRQYLYKNETLVNFLGIDYELCTQLGLQSLYKTKTKEESNKEFYNRNKSKLRKEKRVKYKEELKAEGKLTKKEQITERRAKIKDLLAKGLTQKDICLQLDISKRTYIRDREYLKEQGLI